MVTSYTRTAAQEIASKRSRLTGERINLNPKMVGTMHSICYQALKSPKIMEVNYIKEWNDQWGTTYPIGNKMNLNQTDEVTGNYGAGEGDKLLNAINIARNKMVAAEKWPPHYQNFYNAWCDFKNDIDALDFTDLIEVALRDMPYAPGNPDVMFVDEAQDFTRLQLSLVRSWGIHMQWIVLVGDDDQTIYRFTGADPTAFLDPPVPDNMKTVLKQSYRVPRARREQKNYAPRRLHNAPDGAIVEGKIRKHACSYKDPDGLVADAVEILKQGKTCMFLATCSYMLDPLKNLLKVRGLPFGNRYRPTRGDWNPLGGGGVGINSRQLLINFLGSGLDEDYWNIPQFVTWAQFLSVNKTGLKRNVGKKAIARLELAIEEKESGLHTAREVLQDILEPNAIQPALDRNLTWFYENIKSERRQTLEYPIQVFHQYGLEMLERIPPITIGTVHSVKGGEADVVFVFPDISWQADKEFYDSEDGRDSILRVFYVAMTRAYEELVLCKPSVKTKKTEPRLYVKL
jgi:superfamily I DNA/RNA helicase